MAAPGRRRLRLSEFQPLPVEEGDSRHWRYCAYLRKFRPIEDLMQLGGARPHHEQPAQGPKSDGPGRARPALPQTGPPAVVAVSGPARVVAERGCSRCL